MVGIHLLKFLVGRHDGPLVSHDNVVLPSILTPNKHGKINPKCTSYPSATRVGAHRIQKTAMEK